MAQTQIDKENLSYFSDYVKAYTAQSYSMNNVMLSPQLLNLTLKDINMEGQSFSIEEIRQMVMNPHRNEQSLRKLSLHYYNTISLYKRLINFKSILLDFDWEPTPYTLDGKPITISDIHSNAFKRDYAEMSRFFNSFHVKKEFKKVLKNILLYDTYYTSIREYDNHIYLQELPSSHCIIDANSYLGYLFSLDFSYFMNSGVDINAYAPQLRAKYGEILKSKQQYNTQLPQRNGAWVYWHPMSPDDSWVFKYNDHFAGSVPPLLDALIDYSKIDTFKELEDTKKQLEAYKVIFATVPRMTNNKSGAHVDDFAISAEELGKFVSTVKESLKVDFKAAPLENFKAFDFSPAASEKDLLETELKNIMTQTGLSDSVTNPSTMNVSSSNIYKTVSSNEVADAYSQFETFCEYQVNRRTKKYKFKIKFVGTLFDREERKKSADSDMQNGIITPAIYSSRGIQMTDANNTTNMMYGLGFPELLRPVKTAATMSNDEKSAGAPKKSETELTDAGAQTLTTGANDEKKEAKL